MPFGAVRHPQIFVDHADSAISANANTKYAGINDIAITAGRKIQGFGTQVTLHDQNAAAGSTDNPNTIVSTMKMEITVHATRPICAGVNPRRLT